MRKYLLASAAGAAVVVAATGAFAQQLSKMPTPVAGMAQYYQGKTAPVGTTEVPQAIPLVNTGDFWFGVYGRADMDLVMAGGSSASVAAHASNSIGGVSTSAVASKNKVVVYPTSVSGYQGSRLGFNSDQQFAPGWDAYEDLEMRINYMNGSSAGESGSSTGLANTGSATATSAATSNGSAGLFEASGFSFITITGQNFGAVEMGRDGTFQGQPNVTEDLFGQDPATTALSLGTSRVSDQFTYRTNPAMLGGKVVIGGGLTGNWGGNNIVTSNGVGSNTAPDANSSFFDQAAPEWGVSWVPDPAWNIYYGGMVYLNGQPTNGFAETTGLGNGLGTTGVVNGAATQATYGINTNAAGTGVTTGGTVTGGNLVAPGKKEWLNEAAFKYNAGFWQTELLLGNESGLMLEHPVSANATSDLWEVGGGMSFLLGAPSYKPGNSVTQAGTQLVGFQVWLEREMTKVDVVNTANTVIEKASTNPMALKTGVHWEYHFTPNFFYTAGFGYIFNYNGSGSSQSAAPGGLTNGGNSWQGNTGFDFYF